MLGNIAGRVIEEAGQALDIPETAYEAAKRRYRDLADWLNRPESSCRTLSPRIYSQGSFRLGTVIRPITDTGEYDLDLGCRLQQGVSKQTHTQKQLKHLIGRELAAYREARRIKAPIEEMHRCWRLKYADELNFHMDTVPSIPETSARRQLLVEAIASRGNTKELARMLAEHTGAITDDRSPNYAMISDDWRISNSEGYALWFESRMKLAASLLQERAMQARVGRVDDLPVYRWKSPLQVSVQLLKRHRDVMFQSNQDSQPISIIITTLAGLAYRGEATVADALDGILSSMDRLINAGPPRVPNPVNPAEDFADKWTDPKYRQLQLEAAFRAWLARARSDFQAFEGVRDVGKLVEVGKRSLATTLSTNKLSGIVTAMSGGLLSQAVTPGALSFPPTPVSPTRPGGFA